MNKEISKLWFFSKESIGLRQWLATLKGGARLPLTSGLINLGSSPFGAEALQARLKSRTTRCHNKMSVLGDVTTKAMSSPSAKTQQPTTTRGPTAGPEEDLKLLRPMKRWRRKRSICLMSN